MERGWPSADLRLRRWRTSARREATGFTGYGGLFADTAFNKHFATELSRGHNQCERKPYQPLDPSRGPRLRGIEEMWLGRPVILAVFPAFVVSPGRPGDTEVRI